MKSRMKVGTKGQVVIPKAVRDIAGIREGTEVIIEARDGAVYVRRAGPPVERYVDYFAHTFAKKPRGGVDVRQLLLEERLERQSHLR